MGRVRFDAADSMPGQLDANIYSLTFKLLFTSRVGDKSAASSWAISLENIGGEILSGFRASPHLIS